MKEVLERLRVTGTSRASWPVLELEGRIVWMRGVELEPEPGIHVVRRPPWNRTARDPEAWQLSQLDLPAIPRPSHAKVSWEFFIASEYNLYYCSSGGRPFVSAAHEACTFCDFKRAASV